MPPVSLGSLSGLVALAPMAVEGKVTALTKLKFLNHFHPHVCTWIATLNRDGIPGLLTLKNQQLTGSDTADENAFESQYKPNHALVHSEHPTESVDFRREGGYALYNWELFFHIPTLIASRLSQNQRFEEAVRWLHFVFNPTDDSASPSKQRFWKFRPFFDNGHPEKEQIREILRALSTKDAPERPALEQAVQEWETNPFKPHLVARSRITAYQKHVVMKYIDTLIAWGDQLFRRETIEAINEATQYYILAYNILGPRLERIPPRGTVPAKSYAELKKLFLGEMSNPVQFENIFPNSTSPAASNGGSAGTDSILGVGEALFFCIPQNDKLLSYWDTVADRLFKIRHCMNIEGVMRELPLFEPPIDPALLVQATAMGVDLSSVLNDMNAPLPAYRFSFMLQKALELCGELRALGSALLSALEKQDAEALSVLRSGHELGLLDAVRNVKALQVSEATDQLEGLKKSREVVNIRYEYYRDKAFMNTWEGLQLTLSGLAFLTYGLGAVIEPAAGAAHAAPDVEGGTSGKGPHAVKKHGGSHAGRAAEAWARSFKDISTLSGMAASMAGTLGGYKQREEESDLQERLSAKELEQIDKQIAAAQIRGSIAEVELTNHDLQGVNALAADEALRTKYTNQDLYNWMITQTSAVFFQCYKLTYDAAKRLEKTYRFERGLTSSNFIQFGYWDSLKKGLLSGERLYVDLKRLEMAYLEQNKREYEITRQISLVLHDPMALIVLKETGRCHIRLPEELFDMDYPGHYFRRIKSVSLTIPCVTGPYTSINCTLTLLKNKIRVDPNAQVDYPEDQEQEDNRFLTNFAAMQSIATSTAQNDSGLFEVNFRDERYLPFEGAGAISEWRLEMPKENNAFDFDTISDVILKISYTAREGGALLGDAARAAATMPPAPSQNYTAAETTPPAQDSLRRMFSARHEFPSEWHRFLHPTDPKSQSLQLWLTQERFPFQFRGRDITIENVELFLKLKNLKDGVDFPGGTLSVTSPGGTKTDHPELTSDESYLNWMPHAVLKATGGLGTWAVEPNDVTIKKVLTPEIAEDLIILCHYSVDKLGGG